MGHERAVAYLGGERRVWAGCGSVAPRRGGEEQLHASNPESSFWSFTRKYATIFTMKAIQLLYAKNLIVRHEGLAHQHLAFSMAVLHLAVEKLVEVHWAGEDGIWHILQAEYRSSIGQQREIWCAEAFFSLAVEDVPLPGDIQFVLHYRAAGEDYWANNGSHNFAINADSGVRTDDDFPVLNIDFQPTLRPGQQHYPITVAVRHTLHPKEVYVRWTTDHWRQTQTSPCFFRRKQWHKLLGSSAQSQPLRLRDLDHSSECRRRLPGGVCDRLRNRHPDALGQ